jgi:predicted NBD/HSP70 family sugar kinase
VTVGSAPTTPPAGTSGPGSSTTAISGTAGAILHLVRNGQASTRGELAAMTGLARSTIAQRVDALLMHRLLIPGGDSASTGGRRPTKLAFNGDAGVVLAGDLGATHSRVAITDLAGAVLAQDVHDIAVAEGPEIVLSWLEETFERMLLEIGRGAEAVRGIGVGLPGPVEFATGRPVSPPIMPGWNLYPVGARLSERFSAPALVDNDVNIMSLGEYWSTWRDEDFLLYVKIGTGIGSGIVAHGRVHRGSDGAAGDIGHIHVPDHDDVVCRCGNLGCLEAIAGGAALATRLRELGLDTSTGRDVVAQVLHGEQDAVRLIRQAGHVIGGVLATCVNVLNPAVIVIGGDMAEAGEPLLAGIREVVYRRSLPLATGRLRIMPSVLGDEAGITGAAVMVIETILAPAAVDALVSAV